MNEFHVVKGKLRFSRGPSPKVSDRRVVGSLRRGRRSVDGRRVPDERACHALEIRRVLLHSDLGPEHRNGPTQCARTEGRGAYNFPRAGNTTASLGGPPVAPAHVWGDRTDLPDLCLIYDPARHGESSQTQAHRVSLRRSEFRHPKPSGGRARTTASGGWTDRSIEQAQRRWTLRRICCGQHG